MAKIDTGFVIRILFAELIMQSPPGTLQEFCFNTRGCFAPDCRACFAFDYAAQTVIKTLPGIEKTNMGRIRRNGYIITWFIGDHKPRHVHVETSKGKFIGRLNLETREGLEGWHPDRRLLKLIAAMEKEGLL